MKPKHILIAGVALMAGGAAVRCIALLGGTDEVIKVSNCPANSLASAFSSVGVQRLRIHGAHAVVESVKGVLVGGVASELLGGYRKLPHAAPLVIKSSELVWVGHNDKRVLPVLERGKEFRSAGFFLPMIGVRPCFLLPSARIAMDNNPTASANESGQNSGDDRCLWTAYVRVAALTVLVLSAMLACCIGFYRHGRWVGIGIRHGWWGAVPPNVES
jgi:hypothetical protein